MPQCLRLEHDGIESKSILLGYDDPSYSAMRKPSRKVFYSAMRGLLLGHEEAESESLLLGRGDASYSSMRKPIGSSFTRPLRRRPLGRDSIESESLLLGRGRISDFGVTVSSRKVFYLVMAMLPTRP